MNLVHALHFHSKVAQSVCVSFGGVKLKAHVVEFSRKFRKLVAVALSNAEQNAAAPLHLVARADQALEKRLFHRGGDSQNFAG